MSGVILWEVKRTFLRAWSSCSEDIPTIDFLMAIVSYIALVFQILLNSTLNLLILAIKQDGLLVGWKDLILVYVFKSLGKCIIIFMRKIIAIFISISVWIGI